MVSRPPALHVPSSYPERSTNTEVTTQSNANGLPLSSDRCSTYIAIISTKKIDKQQGGADELCGVKSADSRYSQMNTGLFVCAIVSSLSSINYGWVMGSVNVPSLVIRGCSEGIRSWDGSFPSCIPMGTTLWGLVVGLAPLGALFGSLFSGHVADRIGRKRTLSTNNVFFVAGALLIATTTSIPQLAIGRFVSGIGCGIASNIVSTYNSEIATISTRGLLGGFQQLMILAGIFISQIASIGLSSSPLWRVLFAFSGGISIFQSILFVFLPESPKYLAIIGDLEQASASLQKIRPNLDISLEFENMLGAIESGPNDASDPKPSAWDVLTGKTDVDMRHLAFSVLFLMMSQQWSGAKGVMFYSTEVLSKSFELSENEIKKIPSIAQLLTIGISGVGVVAVIIGMNLLDRIGRRSILIWSSLATCICSAMIVVGSKCGIAPIVSTFMYVFNLVFQCGSGFIPYLSASELLPYKVLASISSLAASVNGLVLFVVSLLFPIFEEALDSYLFIPFIVTNLITFSFARFVMPEAKGKSIIDIIDEYQGPLRIIYKPSVGVTVPDSISSRKYNSGLHTQQ